MTEARSFLDRGLDHARTLLTEAVPDARIHVLTDGEDVAEEEPAALEEFTEEDMRIEEEEILELERKKRGLEERVSAMEKDINGVMR